MALKTFEGKQSRQYTLINNFEEWVEYTAQSHLNEETPTEYPCWVLEDVQNTYCKEYYNYSTLYRNDLLEMLKELPDA